MTKHLILLVILLSSCTAIPVSQQDHALADSLHFSPAAITAIRTLTNAPLHLLQDTAGLEFEYTPQKNYPRTRKKLLSLGYLLFKSTENYGNLPDQYAVIKSNNQFDIIRLRGTGGHNYGISNDSLLLRLQDWHKRYTLEILGADADWMEAKLQHIPEKDLIPFSKEVYDLCPDIAEGDTRNVEDLVQELKDTKTLYLWWD